MRRLHLRVFGLPLLLVACGPEAARPGPPAPAPAKVPAPEPAPPAPTPEGPGRLDAELVRAAGSAQGVERVKLEVDADGAVRYLSVYHHDDAAVPEPVRKQLDAQFPGARVVRYESEHVAPHGRLFELEVETSDKRQCEFSAKPDGAVVYTECHIDATALPEPVRAALDRAHPGAAIKEVEKKTITGAGDEYEVEFEVDGRLHELYLKPDGAVLRHHLVLPAVLEVPAP